jgi:hypothetical protein
MAPHRPGRPILKVRRRRAKNERSEWPGGAHACCGAIRPRHHSALAGDDAPRADAREPGGVKAEPGAYIGYSPHCVPRAIDNVNCVIVNEALRGIEPMVRDFVMNFARDNELQVVEACLLSDSPAA